MTRLTRAQALGQQMPDQFNIRTDGGTLVLDGDGLVYESCATAEKLETALRRFHTKVLEWMFTTGCGIARVHLTAKGSKKNNRGLVHSAKPYQMNRSGKAKPPLLEPTREAAAQPHRFYEENGITVIMHRELEADDGMMMDAYSIPDALVLSPDKDLRIVPCRWYDMQTGAIDTLKDRYGWISFDAVKGKVIGHGTAFFWAQMLMGDTADNVKGIEKLYGKLCGPSAAYKTLESCTSEEAAANTVLDAYRESGQNPLPEAHCLWLLRTFDDTAEGYIWSLSLSAENRAFVLDCFNSPWKSEPLSVHDGDAEVAQDVQDTQEESSPYKGMAIEDIPPWEDACIPQEY